MNRVCYNYGVEDSSDIADFIGWYQFKDGFTEDAMLDSIWLYKGAHPRLSFHWGSAGNYEQSKAWAVAGYYFWPFLSPTPSGDANRSQCAPTCSLAYGSLSNPNSQKGPFNWHWPPYHDIEGVRSRRHR
jgi:hypothetical protein